MSPRSPSDLPPTSDMVEGILFYPIALVISATIFPGMTFCIPGLLFATVLLLIPLVATALVVLVAAAVVAVPVVLVGTVRRRGRRRSAAEPGVVPAVVVPATIAPAVDFGRPSLASMATAHIAPSEVRTEALHAA